MFFATQETTCLPITFTFPLRLILRIIRVVSSWCFALSSIDFELCVFFSFLYVWTDLKEVATRGLQ